MGTKSRLDFANFFFQISAEFSSSTTNLPSIPSDDLTTPEIPVIIPEKPTKKLTTKLVTKKSKKFRKSTKKSEDKQVTQAYNSGEPDQDKVKK